MVTQFFLFDQKSLLNKLYINFLVPNFSAGELGMKLITAKFCCASCHASRQPKKFTLDTTQRPGVFFHDSQFFTPLGNAEVVILFYFREL